MIKGPNGRNERPWHASKVWDIGMGRAQGGEGRDKKSELEKRNSEVKGRVVRTPGLST